MRDLQRERLKHLMANAMLEIWKKETGSLSSVMIEGTICITSGSGKTVVVQVRRDRGHYLYHFRVRQNCRRTGTS